MKLHTFIVYFLQDIFQISDYLFSVIISNNYTRTEQTFTKSNNINKEISDVSTYDHH